MVNGTIRYVIWCVALVGIFVISGGVAKEASAFAPLPIAQRPAVNHSRQVVLVQGAVVFAVPGAWTEIVQETLDADGYRLDIGSKDQRSAMWLAIVPNDGRTKIDLDETLDSLSGADDPLTQRCTHVERQEGEAPGYLAVADHWSGCSSDAQWIRFVAKPQVAASPSYWVLLQAYFVEESNDAAWQTVNQILASLKVDPAQLLAEMAKAPAPLSPLATPTPTRSGGLQTRSPKGRTAPGITPRGLFTPLPDVTEWRIFLPLIMKAQLVPTPLPTAPAMSEVLVRVNALNVRSGPGVNYPVIASANQNDRFPVTGMVNNCAWLQVLLPTQKAAWVSGGSQYTTLQGSCSNVPSVTAPSAPKARANTGQGCYLFRNYISDELTVTFTNKEGNWNTTFKVARRGTYRACFNPGRYTYTIDVPPPWGSINGMVEVTAGMYQEWPVWGEN